MSLQFGTVSIIIWPLFATKPAINSQAITSPPSLSLREDIVAFVWSRQYDTYKDHTYLHRLRGNYHHRAERFFVLSAGPVHP
ncbi:hypothetical protein IIC38_17355 [candidate division KSB1 bacterium]|nr:hypothetical protein [candidate division KSB1 bacterium]